MRLIRFSLLFGAVAFLSGCSIRGSIEDLEKSASKAVGITEVQGFSSGANGVEVANGYTVSASVGHYADGVQQNVNGYTVYLGLQSTAVSESADNEE